MNKLFKNYLYSSGFQLLSVIIPLIVTPYATRHLGSTSLGIDSYVLSIVQVCNVFGSLGTTIYGNREIAYHRNDPKKLAKVFWEIFLLRMMLCAAAAGVYLVVAFHSEYRTAFLLQTGTLIAYYLDVSWLFIGMEHVKPITLASAVVRTLTTVGIFTLVHTPEDLFTYITIYASGQMVISLTLLIIGRKQYPFPFDRRIHILRHIKPVTALFLPQAASSLYVLFDKVMLGSLASDITRISLYDKAEVIVKAPTVLATALTTVLMPRMAADFKAGRKESLKHTVRDAIDLMLLLFVPVSIGLVIIAQVFVPLYLGAAYRDSVRVVYILAPIIVAIGLSSVSGAQFLIACNETRYLTISYFTSAVFNIVGNCILIPRLNEIGASITTTVAECLVVIIQFYAVRKRLGHLGMVSLAWKKVLAAGVMAAVILPFCHFGVTVVVGLIQIAVGASVYFAMLVLLKDTSIQKFMKLLQSRRGAKSE